MKTYIITSPEGKEYEVSGEGTKDEALAAFAQQYQTQNYSNEGRSRPVSSEAQKPMLERLGSGIGGSVKGMAHDVLSMAEMTPQGALLKMTTGDYLGGKLDEEVQKYQNLKPYLGTAGSVGEVGTDIAATALPIARAGSLVGKVPALVKTLGRAAPAAGDIAANALYAGGREGAQGGSASDILQATLLGGGGAAVPHAVLGGGKALVKAGASKVGEVARRGVTQEARELLDQGVQLTPGQMNPALRGVEEAGKRIPLLAGAIERAQGRAGEQFVTKAVNDAIAPLEAGVKTTGRKAIDEAEDIVSNHFNKFLDDVHIDPADLRAGLVKLDTNLPTTMKGKLVGTAESAHPGLQRGTSGDYVKIHPEDLAATATLTEKQASKLYEVVTDHITPALKQAASSGENISGRTFKNIDTKIGELAREQITKGNSKMGEAYYELQRQLRASLSPKRLGAAEDIKKANQAFKALLAVKKAGNREGGVFTPEQLRKAMVKQGEKPTPLVKAGGEVLKKGERVDYGLTRNVLGLAGLGYGFYDPTSSAAVLGAGLLGRKLYGAKGTRAMSGYLAPGSNAKLLPGVTTKGQKLRRALAAPEYTRAAAQGGRMITTDEE